MIGVVAAPIYALISYQTARERANSAWYELCEEQSRAGNAVEFASKGETCRTDYLKSQQLPGPESGYLWQAAGSA